MPWKLKKDAAGNVVVQDDKPVFVKDDGTDTVLDVNEMIAASARTRKEAEDSRKAKETAETALKAFEGIDATAAKEALEITGKIKDKKLYESGEVDKLRSEIATGFQTKLDEQKASYTKLEGQYHGEKRRNAFQGSKFVQDKIAIPVDMVETFFGSHFKVDANGMLRGYNGDNMITSDERFGEPASFDEALKKIVDAYPNKAAIMKGGNHSGSGSQGGGGGNKSTVRRAEFDKMSPAEQMATAKQSREGKVTIVDD